MSKNITNFTSVFSLIKTTFQVSNGINANKNDLINLNHSQLIELLDILIKRYNNLNHDYNYVESERERLETILSDNEIDY